MGPIEATGWDAAVLSRTNTPAGADSLLRAAVFSVNWSNWLVTFPIDDNAVDRCKSAGPGVMDLSKSEVVFPAAIGVADDLKSNMSADGVMDLPNNNGLVGGWLGLWSWCKRAWLGCGWGVAKDPMLRIGVEFKDMDLNVFPAAKFIGVESCLEWCIDGGNIDKLVATEGSGAGGGGGRSNALDVKEGVDVCKRDLESAAKWDKVLLCKMAVEDDDGVPTNDIW